MFSLFCGADLLGEFDTREEAERALDEAVAGDASAADGLAVVEFNETASVSASRSPALRPDSRTHET